MLECAPSIGIIRTGTKGLSQPGKRQVPPHSIAKYRAGWSVLAAMPASISKNDEVIAVDELFFSHRAKNIGDFA